MRIAVFGLGYVGTVSAACLAADGHEVVGVDPNATKVALVNRGEAPIIEAELSGLIRNGVAQGRLRATAVAAEALSGADLSMLCVGTPSRADGSLDLAYVTKVAADVGAALSRTDGYHVVVARSTMLPGTVRGVVVPELERGSGRRLGDGYAVCYNPEFLREGSAVFDFRNPPLTVIGASEPRAGALLAELYRDLPAPVLETDLEVAEMVKYVSNSWHALKVGFANEIGALCRHLRLDGHKVMDMFAMDAKLNISKAYLRPGFAFGGSCLPKDVRAISALAREAGLDVPIISSVLRSNERHIARAAELALAGGSGPIGILGLSFKPGTDDLRESAVVDLVERLLAAGREVRVYDRNVHLAALLGANREYIEAHIPHIARLMVPSPEEVVRQSQTVVVANADPAFRDALRQVGPQHRIVDLVRLAEGLGSPGAYDGIAW